MRIHIFRRLSILCTVSVGIVAAFAGSARAQQIQVNEQGTMLIDGNSSQGSVAADPISGFQALMYALPFTGNAGDIILTEPGTSEVSDIIRFPGNNTLEFFSVADPKTTLATPANAGDTNVKLVSVSGYAVGERFVIDRGSQEAETVTISTVGTRGATGTGISLTTALTTPHANGVSASAPLQLADVAILPTTIDPNLTLEEPASGGTIWLPGTTGIGGDASHPDLQYTFESDSVPEPGILFFAAAAAAMLLARRNRIIAV